MVVIQKREYGKNGTTYSQYRLNIPQKIIDLLKWNYLDEIDFLIINGELVCKNITIPSRKKT